MSFGMQVRLWLRRASPIQAATTWLVLAVAVTTMALSVVPAAGDGDEVSAGDTSFETSGPGGFAGPDDGEGGAGPVGEGGTAVPGSTGAGGGSTAAGGGGGSATTLPAGAASGNTGTAKRTASDVGVTADTVKIGFVVANLGGLDQAGYGLGLRTDIAQVIDAYVDEVNENGGINGRRVVAETRKVDPLSQSDQIAGCRYLLQDRRVFGVVETQVYIFAATQRCFTLDGQTPFVHGLPLSAGFQAQARGLDVSVYRNYDRVAREWVHEAVRTGHVAQGTKTGVFTDACEPGNGVIKNILIPGLEQAGASVTVAEIPCDPESQQTQVPNAVLKTSRAGVTHMFMATFFVGVQTFLTNADTQGFRPKYFSSGWNSLDQDLQTQNFPASQWNGVRAVTSSYSGWQAAGKPLPEPLKRCSAALTSRGLEALEYTPRHGEAIQLCDHFRVMVDVARAAGTNLTRAGWAATVPTLAPFEAALTPSVDYAPGRYDGGQSVAIIEWRASCKCWVQVEDYRRSAF